MLAAYNGDGSVDSVKITGGPQLLQLRETVTTYINSWHVNVTARNLECPITISFRIDDSGPTCSAPRPSKVSMTDTQHFIVSADGVGTCDPMATRIRHHFLFIHWYSLV